MQCSSTLLLPVVQRRAVAFPPVPQACCTYSCIWKRHYTHVWFICRKPPSPRPIGGCCFYWRRQFTMKERVNNVTCSLLNVCVHTIPFALRKVDWIVKACMISTPKYATLRQSKHVGCNGDDIVEGYFEYAESSFLLASCMGCLFSLYLGFINLRIAIIVLVSPSRLWRIPD